MERELAEHETTIYDMLLFASCMKDLQIDERCKI